MLSYLLYRFKWHIAPYLPTGKLIHLDLELNNNCNQSCISCWHSQEQLPFKIQHMNINRAYGYLLEGRELGALSVKYNFRGEPLLYKYSLELLIMRAKDLGYVDTMINTNGVFLTKDRIMSLSEAGLDTCIISVDSLDKKTYNKIHNCGRKKDYDKLVKNLSQIANLLHNKKIKTKVKLNFHINEYNRAENLEGNSFYRSLIKVMKPVFRYTENRKGQDISIERDRKRKKKCPHMYRRLTVLANGKIYPCCLCYDEPEDIKMLGDLPLSDECRRALIRYYKKGVLNDSCKNCKSGDLYK